MAFPLAAVGLGASLLGGLLGGGKGGQQPGIDPAQLARLFGPNALAGDTQKLYALLMRSPAWSQMMNQSALQGSQTANATRAALASRGLSSTPYASFLNAAGRGYGASMQRQGQQNLFMQALQQAMEGLQNRQSLYGQSILGQQGQPTWGRMIGGSLLNAGAGMFSNPDSWGNLFGGGGKKNPLTPILPFGPQP